MPPVIRYLHAALCLLLLAALAGCGETRPPSSSYKPFRIGAILSITGRTSFIGVPEQRTLVAYVKEINSSGGLAGHPIELLVSDTKGRPELAVAAARKLAEDPSVVAVIGPSTTAEGLAVVPVFQVARIPVISLAAGVQLVSPVRSWVFKDTPSDVHAVGRIYDYLSRRDIERIAMATANDAFGEGGENQLREQAPLFGMHIVRSIAYNAKTPDPNSLTAYLRQVKDSNAQALVVWGTHPGPSLIARLSRRLGLRQLLVNSYGIASRHFIEQAGPAAEGVVFPASPLLVADSLDWNNPLRAVEVQYQHWYESRMHEPASAFGGHAWDALNLLRDAIRKTSASTSGDLAGPLRAKVRAWLEETRNFAGTAGIFNFSPADHNGLSRDAFAMVRIQNGHWVFEP